VGQIIRVYNNKVLKSMKGAFSALKTFNVGPGGFIQVINNQELTDISGAFPALTKMNGHLQLENNRKLRGLGSPKAFGAIDYIYTLYWYGNGIFPETGSNGNGKAFCDSVRLGGTLCESANSIDGSGWKSDGRCCCRGVTKRGGGTHTNNIPWC